MAVREKLNSNYLRILWQVLNDKKPSFPLDSIRSRWRQAKPQDVDALVAELAGWQEALWRFVPIGSYRYGNTIRQLPNEPVTAETHTLKLPLKPAPGQSEVVLYLTVREFPAAPLTLPSPPEGGGEGRVRGERGYAVWHRPRFEGGKQPPLLLRDYAQFGPRFDVDYPVLFADTAKHLAAAVELANDRMLTTEAFAAKHHVVATLLAAGMGKDPEALKKFVFPQIPFTIGLLENTEQMISNCEGRLDILKLESILLDGAITEEVGLSTHR